jgi:tetratricopeptide (TPR) repeat protein
LAEDLERWSADQPVSVYRGPLTTRVLRWGRRHRTIAASVAVLMATAIVGLAIGAVLINRERARAEASFHQARAAVDKYFTTVSESRLLNVPGLQPLRKELLELAQTYYQDFLRQRGDDPSVRAEAATSYFRVSWITQTVGRLDDSLPPLKRAIALYTQLVRDHPDVVEYRRNLATVHSSAGLFFLGLGRHEEALQAHGQALALRAALARAEPNDPLTQNDLARTYHNIGNVYRSDAKVDEALAEWDKGLAIQRALISAGLPEEGGRASLTGRRGPSAMIREDHARLHIELANVFRQRGQHAKGAAALEEARKLLEGLVRERPSDLACQSSLADVFRNEGLIQTDLGRYAESESSYRKSLAGFEKLAAANPDVPLYRTMIVELGNDLSWTLVPQNRAKEALALLRQSIARCDELLFSWPDSFSYRILLGQILTRKAEIEFKEHRGADVLPQLRRALGIHEQLAREHPKDVRNESCLAEALRHLGRAEAGSGQTSEAREHLERAIKIEERFAAIYPWGRHNLACSLAFLIPVSEPSQRESVSLRAIDALRQALRDGFSDFGLLSTDPDLDALRSRDDFKALIAGMKAKGQ